jgi:hypothetical protein
MAKQRPPQDPVKQVKELKKQLAKQKREERVHEKTRASALALRSALPLITQAALSRKCHWERTVAAC